MTERIRTGRYRHYKGPEYIVLGVARHSETEEELVVYRTDYGDRGLWVRPLTMFTENVEFKGKQIPRFEFLADE
ncbi:DUF1653 domain-containing protein [Rubinisphaera margarita]|uniref:DUF1653 domain-containing protein n=1 Tax=Rubinisphaera margarita TaxID=2909586 RepID=UPI001EE96BB5|nr:DUF1653 domain-containing protein [Rubinisphaera margarita]MCG6157479.1 DUF1653 domain-containing protein [Rubinisphaera margarita]